MPGRLRPRQHLVALTVAFFAMGTAFAVGAPLFQSPDEPAHVDMVRHYAHHPVDIPDAGLRIRSGVQQAVEAVGLPQGGPLDWRGRPLKRPHYPSFDEFPKSGQDATGCVLNIEGGAGRSCQNYHYGHPPTFYLALAAPARVLEPTSFPTQVLVLRLLCLLLVAPLVVLTYLAGGQLWPGSNARPLAAATAVATFAPLAANAAGVNNDSLTLLAAGLTTVAATRVVLHPSTRAAVALGGAVGLGLLVKSPFMAMALASGVMVVAAALGRPRREGLRMVAGFAVPVALGGAWWVANLARFGTLGQPGSEILQPVRRGPWNNANPVSYAVDHIDELVNRFWGLYGQTAVEIPPAWRAACGVGAGVLCVVWLACRRWQRPTAEGIRVSLLGLFPVVLAVGALSASFDVYRDNGEVRGLLGRYLYPAVPVLALAAVAALGAAGRRVHRARSLALAAGTVGAGALAAASAVRAFHGFYGTRDTSLALDRADTVAPVASVGPWLVVLAGVWVASMAIAVLLSIRPVTAEPPS